MDVVYTWRDGSTKERCQRRDLVLEEKRLCDHCNQWIPAHTSAVLLSSRTGVRALHRACAEQSCHLAILQSRPTKRLHNYLEE